MFNFTESFTMEIPQRDGDGYLIDRGLWTPEIARAMAQADGFALAHLSLFASLSTPFVDFGWS